MKRYRGAACALFWAATGALFAWLLQSARDGDDARSDASAPHASQTGSTTRGEPAAAVRRTGGWAPTL